MYVGALSWQESHTLYCEILTSRSANLVYFSGHGGQEFGLIPIQVAIWGPFVLLNMEHKVTNDVDDVSNEWLGSASEILSTNGVDSSLSYICRREYTIECNWKVW